MKRFDGDDSRSDGYHFHRGSGGQGMFPFLNGREVQQLAGVGDCNLSAALEVSGNADVNGAGHSLEGFIIQGAV